MSNQSDTIRARTECANAVAAELFQLEHFIEQSLAKSAGMIATLAARREELGLSILHGQQLLNGAVNLAGLLNSAREAVGEVHRTAALTQRQVGVRTVAGNPGDKPDQPPHFDTDPMGADDNKVKLRRVA